MLTKLLIILFIIIFIIFILSALAPVKSQHKFWIFIYKARSIMDFISYWFFNICGIITLIIAIIVLLKNFL